MPPVRSLSSRGAVVLVLAVVCAEISLGATVAIPDFSAGFDERTTSATAEAEVSIDLSDRVGLVPDEPIHVRFESPDPLLWLGGFSYEGDSPITLTREISLELVIGGEAVATDLLWTTAYATSAPPPTGVTDVVGFATGPTLESISMVVPWETDLANAVLRFRQTSTISGGVYNSSEIHLSGFTATTSSAVGGAPIPPGLDGGDLFGDGLLAGREWVWRNPLPQGNSLHAVVWSGSQFVACGRAGTILTSPDGSSWTQQNSGVGAFLRAIAVGENGEVLAVGRNGATSLSTDGGTSWTGGTVGSGDELRDVFWTGERWLVAPKYEQVFVSGDGRSWFSVPDLDGLRSVGGIAAAGGRIVLVGSFGEDQSPRIGSSSDGLSWVFQGLDDNTLLLGPVPIVWTGAQFLAAGGPHDDSRVATSPDGLTWTVTPALGFPVTRMAWTGSRLVGYVGIGFPGEIVTSPDGVEWTVRAPGVHVERFLVDGNTVFAVGDAGGIYASEDGGLTWQDRDSGVLDNLNAIVSDGSGYVVAGAEGTLLSSPDGAAWGEHSSGSTGRLRAVAESGGSWIAVGRDELRGGGSVAVSDDGVDWSEVPFPPSRPLYSVARLGGQWVATGESELFASSDGLVWGALGTPPDHPEIRGIASDGSSRWVIVGGNEDPNSDLIDENEGVIQISDDGGATWADAFRMDGEFFRGVAWTGSQFMAVGDFGAVATSDTGAAGTWTLNSFFLGGAKFRAVASDGDLTVIVGSSTDDGEVKNGFVATTRDGATVSSTSQILDTRALYGVAKAGAQWVAVADDGAILTSPDAERWTRRESGTDHELYGVAPTPDGLVAVGEGGTILTSAPSLPGPGDSDGDGIADLLEYYFGTEIGVPNPSPLALESPGTIRWPAANVAGLEVAVQWSPDLSTWLASGESASGIPARSIAVTEIASGVLRAQLLGSPAGGGEPAFLRLAVGKR